MKNKHLLIHLLSFGILAAGFLSSILFCPRPTGIGWTGKLLALIAFMVVACSFLMGGKLIPLVTASGYLLSFIAAAVFQRDGVDPGGGRTNNFGSLWITVFFTIFVLSLYFESVYANRRLS